MILEVARITVKPGAGTEFERGVAAAESLFRRAAGCHGYALRRSVDSPDVYWLLIRWETRENHTGDFVATKDFQEFLALVAGHFAQQPVVDHAEEIWTGF